MPDEKTISLRPSAFLVIGAIAEKVGVDEALVLAQIAQWINHHNVYDIPVTEHLDMPFIVISISKMRELGLSFYSRSKLARIINKLEKERLIYIWHEEPGRSITVNTNAIKELGIKIKIESPEIRRKRKVLYMEQIFGGVS